MQNYEGISEWHHRIRKVIEYVQVKTYYGWYETDEVDLGEKRILCERADGRVIGFIAEIDGRYVPITPKDDGTFYVGKAVA